MSKRLMTAAGCEDVLLKFTHGLGDAVQMSVVLQHLKKYRPEWHLYLHALPGKESAGHGYCKKVSVFPQIPGGHANIRFDKQFDIQWHECNTPFDDSPSTKAMLCVRTVFDLKPDLALCRYRINVSDVARSAAKSYVEEIGHPILLLHYEGNTSTEKKNLNHDQAAAVCRAALATGRTPVILDWDKRSPLPNGKTIFCPDINHPMWKRSGSGDAEIITALCAEADLCVGVDSGPQKCMMASGAPTICVWTKHSPIRYADLSDAMHMVREDWAMNDPVIRDDGAMRFFVNNYQYRTYSDLESDLFEEIMEQLRKTIEVDGDLVLTEDWWVRKNATDQDWVIISDVYHYDAYKTRVIPKTSESEFVVDIGAHIGTFARLWYERNPNAKIVCVEMMSENVRALRRNVGSFAEVIEAACTYTEELYVLSSLGKTGVSTGGSRLVTRDVWETEKDPQYDKREDHPLTMSLHDIMSEYDRDFIDVLKLDCEGSEYSILANAPLDKIKFIVGEYHGFDRWEEFRRELFPRDRWDYGHMSRSGEFGNFHLRNRAFAKK